MAEMTPEEEQAKKMVKSCPRDWWIVDDLEQKKVYYKNQKPPHTPTDTPYTTNHVLIAHTKFIGPNYDLYHIALDREVNDNPKIIHYTPAWNQALG
ncbi:MAG: hypothetical protein ACJ71W_21715 [Terriglobales bacterium]